jgi:hypothetical protein
MGTYETPVDIANSALDEVGADPITSLTQDATRAAVVARNIDKMRQAELRRNIWRFSVRKAPLRTIDVNTMFAVWATYNPAKTYVAGSIVDGADARPYVARGQVPLATPPGYPNELFWDLYFGPVTAEPWDHTVGYFAGELVYILNGLTPSVYLSRTNANTDNPGVVANYDTTVTYSIGETVISAAVSYQSTIDLNFAQTPVVAWAVGTTYATSAEVLATDGNLYTSVGSGNTGHNPVGDAGVHWTLVGAAPWAPTPASQADVMQGNNWLLLDTTLRSLAIIYPAGSGPRSQASTRNLYRLPAGYMREAPQDPKAGSQSWLGAPSGLIYDDWEFEGQWLVTRESQVIVFRFAADVSDVSQMDPLFQEGWALRLAEKICERLTQSTTKISTILQKYKVFMGEARAVNGIEEGSDEPPLDDYLACRS